MLGSKSLKIFNFSQYRWIVISASIAFIIWSPIFALLDPNIYDPFIWRALLCFPLIVIAILSFRSTGLQKILEGIFFIACLAATILHYYLTYKNGLRHEYITTAILLSFCTLAFFNKPTYKVIILFLHLSLANVIIYLTIGNTNILHSPTSFILLASLITAIFFALLTHHVFSKIQAAYKKEVEENTNLKRWSSLGKMAGGVAHEINTPLTTVLLSAEILNNSLEKKDVELSKKHLEKILKEGKRIGQITKNLRQLTKEEIPLKKEPVRLLDIIQAAIHEKEDKIKQENIIINTSYLLDKNSSIFANPDTIKSVLEVLLQNAIDALKNIEPKAIFIDIKQEQDTYKIRIQDNGIGIPKNKIKSIFDPFYTTKTVGEGMGIGLSVSKSQVAEHDGQIYYDENEKLTTFVLVLPVYMENSKKIAS